MKIFSRIYFIVFLSLIVNSPVFSEKESSFDSIDQYVDNIQLLKNETIPELSQRITKNLSGDLEKTRAIFRWISMNIGYDVKSYLAGKPVDGSAENTLKSGKSVCEGYANLFNSMAKNVGLESVKISGFSKGYGYIAGNPLPQMPDHAWNAVKINGEWKLLDITWAAGAIENNEFKKKFEDHYFLTDPEQFIYDHFPEDSHWQFLRRSINKAEYVSMPYVRPAFFKNKLGLTQYSQAEIQSGNEIEVELKSSNETLILASLIRDRKIYEQRTLIQRDSNRIIIHVRLPETGTYTLRIFAKKKSDLSRLYSWAMDYKVVAKAGTNLIYPKSFSHLERDVILIHPFDGILSKNSEIPFDIIVPLAETVAVKSGKDWAYLEKNGDRYRGKVLIQNGNVTIFARFPGEQNFSGLFQYNVE